MKKALFWFFAGCVMVVADEDSFRERFADPETRMAALAELTPGTPEYYFHTALAHQLAGRDADFHKTIADWKNAVRNDTPIEPLEGLEQLEIRQLLIDHAKRPDASLKKLIEELGLEFDDTRPDAAAQAAGTPTRLDPMLINAAAFEDACVQADDKQPYSKYRGHRFYQELEKVASFDEGKLRWFYQAIEKTDHPGVVPLVSRILKLEQQPASFTQGQPLLQQLTSGQLADLLVRHPELRGNESFNLLHLQKLQPGAEINTNLDLKEKAAYLQRCLDYALGLPPTQNSLKAHLLYHHLVAQRELGQHPKKDFLAYLALPRASHVLLLPNPNPGMECIRMDSTYTRHTGCPIVEDDVPLIEAYLHHFLSQSDTAADFAPFVEEKRLQQLHATARLLAGENPDRWGKLLDAPTFKALQQETRIGFAPGAPRWLDADAEASLTLELKNTPELLVRIYEIDLPSLLERGGGNPDAGIDLDGLVPHHERRITYPQAPLIQHREAIALPELAGPGVWLVDFVSGQVSARALVRKGQLTEFTERKAGHQVMSVFNEKGQPVADARLSLGKDTFKADANGRITIPDAPNNPPVSGLLRAGKLATLTRVGPREEQLHLQAGFHLDREQLLADQEARLQLRVQLTSHECALPLDRIKDPALVLRAELLGGVTTERVIAEGLKLEPAMEIPFQVPADLLGLTLTLRGTVTPTSGGDPQKLEASTHYRLNLDLQTPRIATAFFSPTADGHRLELRGRNGEPLPLRIVRLAFEHRDYTPTVDVELRTDENGRIELGALENILSVTASGNGIENSTYLVPAAQTTVADAIHLPQRDEILVPLAKAANTPDRNELSLIETNALASGPDVPLRDHFDKLAVRDGRLVIRKLPPGDYLLTQGSQRTAISISAGTESQGLLVSRTRILPLQAPQQPTIAKTSTDNGQLTVHLRDAGPDTSVTVIGRRYQHPYWDGGKGLQPFAPPVAALLLRGGESCAYLTERRLSDEMRYILDRRNARSFPGNLLPRPSLLLNRWTETEVDQTNYGAAGAGEGISESMRLPAAMSKRKGRNGHDRSLVESSPICDFLAMPAVVKFNLRAGKDGTLTLPLDDFRGCQYLNILAADPFASDQRIIPLPAGDTPLRDRRIARPLDPKGHHLATRSAAVLAKGATASIENLLDADWRAFTTLADAHQLLYGMLGDESLREFTFLTEWPELGEEKKLHLLSQHACHEFHLFLARKDRAFFDKHVKPMLAQKPAPTFIDDLLLQRDLNPYLRPYAWQKLNAAEKALLAQALPEARSRIQRELSLRWQLEAPGPDAETMLFTQTLRGTDLALEDSLGLARNEIKGNAMHGLAFLTEKTRRIIIPRIDFENTTLEEAVQFLRLRAAECDSLELDPAKRGINIVTPNRLSNTRIAELKLQNVPIETALKYICDATKTRYSVDDHAITIKPQTETGEDLFTRTFRVPPDFKARMGVDRRTPAIDVLKEVGVAFPPGANATLNGTSLLVTNTPTELDKVDNLTQVLGAGSPSAQPFAGNRSGDMGVERLEALATSGESDPFASSPPQLPGSVGFESNIGGGVAGGGGFAPMLPVFPDSTRLWREANYHRHVGPTDEDLIPLNRFWIDLANWDGKGGFLSPHFNSCTASANDALMCLALLDLPFKAERPEVTVDGTTLRVKARDAMLLFYKDIRRTEKVAAESSLLVRQSFCPLEEKFRLVDGHQVENPVTGDFRPGVPYCASLIVTNPTGAGRRIDLLAQIPAGSIPLDGQPATLSSTMELEPHGVLIRELAFYFPAAGEFASYPLHLSENDTILNHTGQRSLRVSNDPEKPDADSWETIAREGSNDEVLKRLRHENLDTIELDEILWRLKDKGFFSEVTRILGDRLHFDADIAAYGFHHADMPAMRSYLENSDMVTSLGQWLDSPMLEIRPRTHHDWETLEFDPLVNPRAHRFGENPRLSHPEALGHYRAFLDQLAWKPKLDAADQMTLCAFLLLQDRIDEAIARFARIDPAGLPCRVNYDYLHAVVLFYQEKPAEAKAIATAILPTLPAGLWRERFETVVKQADEIATLAVVEQSTAVESKDVAPLLEITSASAGKVILKHRGLESATLRLFSVDLEMLFSNDPFMKNGGGNACPSIQPNATLEVKLAKEATSTSVDLPEALRQGNVLVAADTASTKQVKVLDSGALELRQSSADRTVQVLDAATHKPLVKTYIKVYAETLDGGIRFHKDGYTDLRGKFDYLSHSGEDPANVRRVAILASDPQKGARTVIYDR